MRRTPRISRIVLTWLCAALMALATACAESPEERLAQARAAQQKGEVDQFASFFTKSAAPLLRNMQRAGKRSGIHYMKKIFDVLPEGDIEEVKVEENFAIITIKVRGKKKDIYMLKEDGQWFIHLTSLDFFWAPLAEK